MKVEYDFKKGTFYNADPQKVGEEIETLGNDFVPADVVELARNPETESHKCFTWDDSKAAEKCRLQEARQLLCHLTIKTVESKKSEPQRIPLTMRAYEHAGASYSPIQYIIKHPDRHQELLDECQRYLEGAKAKYGYLTEFQNIWDLIN